MQRHIFPTAAVHTTRTHDAEPCCRFSGHSGTHRLGKVGLNSAAMVDSQALEPQSSLGSNCKQPSLLHSILSLRTSPLLRLSLVSFSSSSELHEHRGTGHEGLNYQQRGNFAVNLELLGQQSQKGKTL